MNPDIFTFGEISLPPYPTMVVIAFLFALIVGYIDALKLGLREQGLDERDLILGVLSFISGVVGARLVYVILNWENFMVQPELIFLFRFAGLSFYGGIIGALTTAYLWCRWRKINFFLVLDHIASYWGAGYGIARIGCFLAGCCYGKVTDLPWGVVMQRVDDLPRHPVQLYATLGVIIGAFFILYLRRRKPFNGFISLAILSAYGIIRFTTEFFREGETIWMGFTNAQLASVALFVISTSAILIIYKITTFNKIKGFGKYKGF